MEVLFGRVVSRTIAGIHYYGRCRASGKPENRKRWDRIFSCSSEGIPLSRLGLREWSKGLEGYRKQNI